MVHDALKSTPLFDKKQPPATRKTDPPTSRMAEKQITESGQRDTQCRQVFAALQRHEGRTSRELADIGDLDRYMVARRLPDLDQRQGLVIQAESRYCALTKSQCVTWYTKKFLIENWNDFSLKGRINLIKRLGDEVHDYYTQRGYAYSCMHCQVYFKEKPADNCPECGHRHIASPYEC